jgi:hypothetical protein
MHLIVVCPEHRTAQLMTRVCPPRSTVKRRARCERSGRIPPSAEGPPRVDAIPFAKYRTESARKGCLLHGQVTSARPARN